MKCRECGSIEVGAYKEIRSLVAEMGITKEDIEKQIHDTVDSMVRGALSENIGEAIGREVRNKVDSYGYSREFTKLVNEAISNQMSKFILDNFTITITNKETTGK